MTAKTKDLPGHYEIDHMDEWDEEARNLMGQAFIDIRRDKTGAFQFCAVTGDMDCRLVRTGWQAGGGIQLQGDDDGELCCGAAGPCWRTMRWRGTCSSTSVMTRPSALEERAEKR